MSRCRARFKLALRFCRQHEDQLKADACAKSLDLGDCNKFWRDVKCMSNDRATKYVNCVADISGDENIAEMWKNYFDFGIYFSCKKLTQLQPLICRPTNSDLKLATPSAYVLRC